MFTHLQHVKFPAVSICNLNMIRYDKLPYGFIDEILEHLRLEGKAESRNTNLEQNSFAAPVKQITDLGVVSCVSR